MNLDGGLATAIAPDPVSCWLSLLRPDCLLTHQVLGEMEHPATFRGVTQSIGVVVRGRWRIRRDGESRRSGSASDCGPHEERSGPIAPVELGAGDVVLILFGDDCRVESLGPDPCELIWGRISIQSFAADIELDGLPDPLVFSHAPQLDRSASTILDLVHDECQRQREGWICAVNQLLRLLVLNALRDTAGKMTRFGPGWLGAFRDAEMTPVLAAMIENPAKDWTVASLAEIGLYSRSHFAKRFREVVGTTPMDALYSLRMQSAELLMAEGVPAKEIARRVGYRSIAAFLAAFRRRTPQTSPAGRKSAVPSDGFPNGIGLQQSVYAEASNPTSM